MRGFKICDLSHDLVGDEYKVENGEELKIYVLLIKSIDSHMQLLNRGEHRMI
jgi:hypothetical protein